MNPLLPPASPTAISSPLIFASVGAALIFILACGLLREPARQRFSAILVAAAGAFRPDGPMVTNARSSPRSSQSIKARQVISKTKSEGENFPGPLLHSYNRQSGWRSVTIIPAFPVKLSSVTKSGPWRVRYLL